jgi:hypothetical protein
MCLSLLQHAVPFLVPLQTAAAVLSHPEPFQHPVHYFIGNQHTWLHHDHWERLPRLRDLLSCYAVDTVRERAAC